MLKDYKNSALHFSLVWVFLWLGITAIPNIFLIPNGIDYINGWPVICTYYLTGAAFGIYFYNLKIKLQNHADYLKQILFLIFIMTAVFLISDSLKRQWPLSIEKTAELMTKKIDFPLFDWRSWLSKFCEIIFQQSFILAYVKHLKEKQTPDKQNILGFCASFTFIHLPLIFFFGWNAFYFILPSFFAGLIFSYLILKFKYGPTLSYAVHLGFYLTLGLYMRYI